MLMQQRPPAQPSTVRLAVIAHIGFVIIGVINTLLGALLPALSQSWQMNDAQAGYLFVAQSAGGMLGASLCGSGVRRFGFPRLLQAGFALMAASLLALSVSGYAAGAVALVFCGVSLGLTIPTTNLLIAELYSERRAAALNVLNLAWGVGAVVSPLYVAALVRDNRIALPVVLLAALLLPILLLMARAAPPTLHTTTADTKEPITSSLRHWLEPYALLTAAVVFFCVGTESGVGGWLASYAQRMDASADAYWALAQAGFWAGLLCGRALAPFILRKVAELQLIFGGLLLALLGMGVILSSRQTAGVAIGALVAGLGMAAVFPTTIAVFTERLGARASAMTGALFMLAGLGAAVVPWVVGQISALYDDLKSGIVTLLFSILMLIALQAAILLRSRRRRR